MISPALPLIAPVPLLEHLRRQCPVLPATDQPAATAAGLISAADPGTGPVPALALAAWPGYAVAAAETMGASALSPVMLSAAPPLLQAGDALPPGCDSVLNTSLLEMNGPLALLTGEVFPGEGVIPAGHHLGADTPLLPGGQQVTQTTVLLAALAGRTHLRCRVPQARIIAAPGDPVAVVLQSLITAEGARLDGPAPDLIVHLKPAATLPDGATPLGALALNGPQPIALGLEVATVVVALPPLPGAAFLAFYGLLRPLLHHLTDRSPDSSDALPLTRKIASAVGMTELVFLTRTAGGLTPLPGGEISLQLLRQATHMALLAPDDEGCAAGELFTACPLERRV